MQQFYVTYENGLWYIKTQGKTAAGGYYTKDFAIQEGKTRARKASGSLVVRKMDGTFETEYSYGVDPFPPRG